MIYAARGEEVSPEANNLTISREDLQSTVAAILSAGTVEKRREIPGIDPARADIITAGALILEQVFEQLRFESMATSRYALREGIIMDSIRKLVGEERTDAHLSDVRRASVIHLAESCHYDATHARTVTHTALSIFDQLTDLHGLGNEEREFLEASALLHDIGYHISHAQHHKHTYYLIRHSELLGFTDREIEIIANVARYHRKSHPKLKHEGFPRLNDRDRAVVRSLAAILRIADGLDRRHKAVFTTALCERLNDRLIVHLTTRGDEDTSIELWGAERRKELFEEVFGTEVELRVERT
jgi:exopolyphosphatase/guanosine-5'-triphosphate,3'-diphosphate pyrophosphatase